METLEQVLGGGLVRPKKGKKGCNLGTNYLVIWWFGDGVGNGFGIVVGDGGDNLRERR